MSSVCLSVCLSVMLCIVALRVSVQGYKLYQRVSGRQVPICLFSHFLHSDAFIHKTHWNTEVKKTQTWFFWGGQSGVHWSCYVLLFTDFVNFSQSCLSGLSLGAFMNCTSWLRSCIPAIRQFVTETSLIVSQYAVHYRLGTIVLATAAAESAVILAGVQINTTS